MKQRNCELISTIHLRLGVPRDMFLEVPIFILKKTKQNNISIKLAFSNLSLVQTNAISFDSAWYFFKVLLIVHTKTPENDVMDSTRIRRFFVAFFKRLW